MRWESLQLHQRQQQQQQQQGSQQQQQQGINGPGKRWGHTCNSIKGGRFLYVFGGYGKDNCQTNQVHVFDTATGTWSQPVMKGLPPTPRDSHTCTTVGDNLFVFGGTDGMNPLKDLYILDTSSHTWISPSVRGEGPDAREGHSAALVGKRLFIFGGCGKSSDNKEVYYNDLYILNTETFVWKQAKTSGTSPSARDSHTLSSWKNKIIVIGGEDGQDYYLSDVHILDAETLFWKELNTSGQKLPPRAGHCTIALGKNLFVFGGFTDAQNLYDDLHMIDIDTGIWTKLMATGDGPSARFSTAGDCLDPVKSGVLVIMGGCNKGLEALNDMYYLHTGLSTVQDDRRLEKLSLKKQLKLKCQEQFRNSPVNDKALIGIDTIADFGHTVPNPAKPSWGVHGNSLAAIYYCCGLEYTPQEDYYYASRFRLLADREKFHFMQLQQGKMIFHAEVTESFPHGYTIETIIDGKALRGILFASKPNSPLMAQNYNDRKRNGKEIDGFVLNGNYYNKSKASKTLKQDAGGDQMQQGKVGKESTSHESKAEVAVGSDVKHVPSVASTLNLNDDMMNDSPNCEAELAKENFAVAKDSISLSLNQDGRIPTSQVHNESEKSI